MNTKNIKIGSNIAHKLFSSLCGIITKIDNNNNCLFYKDKDNNEQELHFSHLNSYKIIN